MPPTYAVWWLVAEAAQKCGRVRITACKGILNHFTEKEAEFSVQFQYLAHPTGDCHREVDVSIHKNTSAARSMMQLQIAGILNRTTSNPIGSNAQR